MTTLLLRGADVAGLLTLEDCAAAVEAALLAPVGGGTLAPAVLGVEAGDGGFHVKAAGLLASEPYFAAKTNANVPRNPERFGLPAIQGVLALFDARTGSLLALMDSTQITALRTAAATAIAARRLARPDASALTPCGCGIQGRDEIIVFDSTGTALQDVAAAAAYEKARRLGRGVEIGLGR